MSQVGIRNDLVNSIEGAYEVAYPGVPIAYPNAPFDRNNPKPLWCEFEIKFNGGDQIGISSSPHTRLHGFVYFSVWARSGAGLTESLSILDWVSTRLGYLSLPGLQVQAPQPESVAAPPPGWSIEQVKFYFFSSPT